MVGKWILLQLSAAGIFHDIGTIILSYLNFLELCNLLTICVNTNITFCSVPPKILKIIIYRNSLHYLKKFCLPLKQYYLQLQQVTNPFSITDISGSTNFPEIEPNQTFLLPNIYSTKPTQLLESFLISIDLSTILSTKWKFDELRSTDVIPPSRIIYNPIYPLFILINNLFEFCDLYTAEFVVYALPGSTREKRGQIIYKREKNELKSPKKIGKTNPVWSPDGIHLAVIDVIENEPTSITFYRYYVNSALFRKIRHLCISVADISFFGWDIWFTNNSVLIPWNSSSKILPNAKFSFESIQKITFHVNNTYEGEIIPPENCFKLFKKGFFGTCGNNKHCFVVKPCYNKLHTHDILEIYEFAKKKFSTIAILHIEGIVHAYSLYRNDNELILMIRSNRHFIRKIEQLDAYEKNQCPLKEIFDVNLPITSTCCKYEKKQFLNYSFIKVNLSTFECHKIPSNISLPALSYSLRCDATLFRYKFAAAMNIFDVSKYFISLSIKQQNFHINKYYASILSGKTGSLKFLHPTLPLFALRTTRSFFINKQCFHFYLLTCAKATHRIQFPKITNATYCKYAIYRNVSKTF